MKEFLIFSLLISISFCEKSEEEPNDEDIQRGYNVLSKIGQDICWYEYLHPPPSWTQPKAQKYLPCYINLNVQRLIEILNEKETPDDSWEFMMLNIDENFRKYVKQFLPWKYAKCNIFLKDPMKPFTKEHPLMEETDLKGSSYPYKGWANCMLSTIESSPWTKSSEILSTKWNKEVTWTEVALQRENENRQMHNVPALVIDDRLTNEAEKLASKLINACGNFVSVMEEHESSKDGRLLGMNIHIWNIFDNSPPANDGLIFTNAFYETGRFYPYPGYNAEEDKDGSEYEQFGQFSQSVWRTTKKVGYGMGRGDGCNYTIVVAKYFPKGNVIGHFKANVLPRSTSN